MKHLLKAGVDKIYVPAQHEDPVRFGSSRPMFRCQLLSYVHNKRKNEGGHKIYSFSVCFRNTNLPTLLILDHRAIGPISFVSHYKTPKMLKTK